MKPYAFEYRVPESLPEALAQRAEFADDSAVLAGGQSLVPLLALRLATAGVLIDLRRVEALRGVRHDGETLRIGAMTRQRDVTAGLPAGAEGSLIAEAIPHIGHVAIRNRGTVGGSLCHADGAAELPAVCCALDAEMIAVGERGERRIAATEFFEGFFSTALEPDEILAGIELRVGARRTGSAFLELARRHGDFALAGAACTLGLGGDGRIASARIALLGVAGAPVRPEAAEALLRGAEPTPEAFAEAGAAAVADVEPASDIHASAEYRRRIASVLVRRALTSALERVPHDD